MTGLEFRITHSSQEIQEGWCVGEAAGVVYTLWQCTLVYSNLGFRQIIYFVKKVETPTASYSWQAKAYLSFIAKLKIQ